MSDLDHRSEPAPEPEERLEPATFEGPAKRGAFASRTPWRWVLGIGTVVLVLVSGYHIREYLQANETRRRIDAAYSAIEADADAIRAFRRQLEDWVAEAAQMPLDTWVDPRLRVSDLHDDSGLYLRIGAKMTGSRETLAAAASDMSGDAITRCLGIAPTSARTLYQKGEFLTPEWLARVDTADEVFHLQVIEEDLNRHISRDLPILRDLLEVDYFLLILEQGASRLDGPVDVFLWDVRQGRLRLRARVESSGRLIPVRVALPGAPKAPPRRNKVMSGAADCSIAAHLKGLTGEATMTFSSAMPEPAANTDQNTSAEAPVTPNGDGGGENAETDVVQPASPQTDVVGPGNPNR